MKSYHLISLIALISTSSFALETWTGELYNITPKNSGVTEEYCKAHIMDTYETTAQMVDNEVEGKNGVKAKAIKVSIKEHAGIFFRTGSAMLSGNYEGKPWQDKVYFYGQSLVKNGGTEQGAWYTKDCKGFYKVGPSL